MISKKFMKKLLKKLGLIKKKNPEIKREKLEKFGMRLKDRPAYKIALENLNKNRKERGLPEWEETPTGLKLKMED